MEALPAHLSSFQLFGHGDVRVKPLIFLGFFCGLCGWDAVSGPSGQLRR